MRNSKNQLDNLKHGKKFKSDDIATKESGARGGIASGESKRKQKSFSEIAKSLGEKKITDNLILEKFNAMGVVDKDGLAINTAIVAGQAIAGMNGNTGAAQWLKELTDEQNAKDERSELPIKIPAEDLIPNFVNSNRNITSGKTTEWIGVGGRGGTKSSFPGEKIPELIMNIPEINAVCCRKVGNTLKDSVYAQIVWGIDKLNASDKFKCTENPMQITYLPTGQRIYFRGADEPKKIKSIRPKVGYLGILWFEEFDQYDGEAEIRNIKASAIRGTASDGSSQAIIFETFNPPPTASAWANKYVADIEARKGTENEKKGTEVVRCSYLDVPEEWLGEGFLEIAEDLKRTNPLAYANEYLGEITGTGGNVFRNLTIRDITDAEINNFDRIYQGLDWGYFPDPNAFVRLYYNKAQKKIYIFAEEMRNRTGNDEMAVILRRYNDFPIIADSAEQKSISYFNANGYRMTGALKPPGSVEYGIKWLCSLSEIVVDRRRCPNTAREFESYEYQKNRDGEFINGYPDKDNHFIDATRYALNNEIEETHYIVKGGIKRL